MFEVRVHVAFHALSETLVDVVHRSQIPLVLAGLYFHETVVVTSLRNDTPLFVHSFTFRRKKIDDIGLPKRGREAPRDARRRSKKRN